MEVCFAEEGGGGRRDPAEGGRISFYYRDYVLQTSMSQQIF
uniref:Uncharacterized protein n=1 Tax=Arundo donax TaxID=35708 RepID=A0A0A9DVH4_ARUDO